MKIYMSKCWKYFESEDPIECMSCNKDFMGIYYGFIVINGIKIYINLCENCKEKLMEVN